MDVGYISLVVAFASAVITCIASLLAARQESEQGIRFSRIGVLGQFLFVTLSSALLLYYLLIRDFQVEYVALYSDRSLPTLYTISAFWGGAEGSLLLWSWILSMFILGLLIKEKKDRLLYYALSITSSVNAFFLAILITYDNPFRRLDFTPADGMGLNPLLINHGMLIHPPTLFIGYAGLMVPYAYAIAGLITENEFWVFRIRKWSLFSWLFLSLGIFFGGLWSYSVLGWGGYWAWDPVENSSLIPWLFSTALLHSVMIQESRRGMKVWNIILSILTFETVIFATFLTRSGIISSVHAFGKSEIGPVFTYYLIIMLFFSLGILFYKFDTLRGENIFESALAREFSFLLNNLLLVVMGATVFWGTIFPLLNEALMGTKIGVGPAFYNEIAGPVMLALVVLMGICVALKWRHTTLKELFLKLRAPLFAGLAFFALFYFLGFSGIPSLVGFAAAGFAAAFHVQEYLYDSRAFGSKYGIKPLRALFKIIIKKRRRYGGYIVHLAMLLIFIGIVGSAMYQSTYPLTLKRGESTVVSGYTFVLNDYAIENRAKESVLVIRLTVSDGRGFLKEVEPEIVNDLKYQSTLYKVSIISLPLKDIYVIPQGVKGDVVSLRVNFIPLVSFIWLGGVVLTIGVIVGLLPSLRKEKVEKK
jgi:cytochrome c-type biogenesis protein CcmF